MKITSLFNYLNQSKRFKSRAFLSPFWWSLGVRDYKRAFLSFVVFLTPVFALGSFLFLLSGINNLGFGIIRPLLISESFWPIVIIFISFYCRNRYFLGAQKEGLDSILAGWRLGMLRANLLLRYFLLLASTPFIMRFLLNLDPSFFWVERYLELGIVGFIRVFY